MMEPSRTSVQISHSTSPTPAPNSSSSPSYEELRKEIAELSASNEELCKHLLRSWAVTVSGFINGDDAIFILENGVDHIYRLHNVIESTGREIATNLSQSLQRLPREHRRNLVAEAFSKRTPAKRNHDEMSSPSTGATGSSSGTLSSGRISSTNHTPTSAGSQRRVLTGKRLKTSPPSSLGSGRNEYCCPFCSQTIKNTIERHVSKHLEEVCPTLRAVNEQFDEADEADDTAIDGKHKAMQKVLLGCGYCGGTARINKYFGVARFGLDKLVEHVIRDHGGPSAKLTWRTNNAINNVLTHSVFGEDYEVLRQQKYPYTTSTSLAWPPGAEAEAWLCKLEKYGGSVVVSNGNGSPLDQAGKTLVIGALNAASPPHQGSNRHPHVTMATATAQDAYPQSSSRSASLMATNAQFVVGVEPPNPFVTGDKPVTGGNFVTSDNNSFGFSFNNPQAHETRQPTLDDQSTVHPNNLDFNVFFRQDDHAMPDG